MKAKLLEERLRPTELEEHQVLLMT